MKKIIFILIGLIVTVSSAQEINWMSMNEALAAQKKMPKKIFMDVYTDWCGPCKLLDKNTFRNKDVADYVNKNFYAVKFNAEGTEEVFYKDFTYTNPNYKEGKRGRNSQHFLASALKINSYPSIVFFDEQGGVIAPIPGYRTPQQLELYLKMMYENDYKTLTSGAAWRAYEKQFESTFKG